MVIVQISLLIWQLIWMLFLSKYNVVGTVFLLLQKGTVGSKERFKRRKCKACFLKTKLKDLSLITSSVYSREKADSSFTCNLQAITSLSHGTSWLASADPAGIWDCLLNIWFGLHHVVSKSWGSSKIVHLPQLHLPWYSMWQERMQQHISGFFYTWSAVFTDQINIWFIKISKTPILKNPKKWHTQTERDTVHESFVLKAQWTHLKADTCQFIVNVE